MMVRTQIGMWLAVLVASIVAGTIAGCEGAGQLGNATVDAGTCRQCTVRDASRTDARDTADGGVDAGRTKQPPTKVRPIIADASVPAVVVTDGADPDAVVSDASTGPAPMDAALPSMPETGDAAQGCLTPENIPLQDMAGNVLESGLDDDCDGIADTACIGVVYDAAGNSTSRWTDHDCDGEAEECESAEYNVYGLPTRVVLREPCDGPPTACQTNSYTAYGALFERVTATGGCEGPQAECRLIRWAPPGDNVWFSETYMDEGCDGTPDRDCAVRTDIPSEDARRPTMLRIDEDCDGTPESGCWIREENSAGSPILQGIDDDCDGEVDRNRERWSYDSAGREISYNTKWKTNSVSELEARTEYDDQGRRTRVAQTNIGSGSMQCRVDHYDEAGLLVRTELRGCSSSTVTSCTTFRHDANGSVILEEQALSCDSAPMACTEHTYDSEGRLTLLRSSNCNGMVDRCDVTAYDGAGNAVYSAWGIDCGGSQSHCTTHTFDAQGRQLTQTYGPCEGSATSCVDYNYAGPNSGEVHVINGCGKPESCMTTQVSVDGHYGSVREDVECDGVFDNCYFVSIALESEERTFLRFTRSVRNDPDCTGFILP